MIELIIRIVPIVISLSAFGVALLGYRNAKQSNVADFFKHGDSDEHKEYRLRLYETYKSTDDKTERLKRFLELEKETQALSKIISFYDFWSIMVKRKYLPFDIFDGMAGEAAINVHEQIMQYIEFRRNEKESYMSEYYAREYSELVCKIKNTYRKK